MSSNLPLLSAQVQGPLQDAITACVKENPRPPDPVCLRYWLLVGIRLLQLAAIADRAMYASSQVQFVGNYLKGMRE